MTNFLMDIGLFAAAAGGLVALAATLGVMAGVFTRCASWAAGRRLFW